MSLKAKLVSVISAFTLVLGMLIMGVLAVSQVNVNMGGNISFTADDVYAHVTGNITGATASQPALDVTYSAKQTTGNDTVWKKLDLNFDTSATPVVFSITVENLSTERTLTVTLTDTIASETPNLLKTITTTSGAYTSGDIIILDPQGETNDTVQFTLTLSVEDKNTSLSNASFSYNLQLFDVSVAPEPPEITGFTFTTSDADATVTLTSYTGNEANLVIPSSFSILDGKYVEGSDYTITAIADSAFEGNLNLQSVTIPDSVTSIGDDAFSRCSALTEVNFGADSLLNSIGRRAFEYCSNLTSITIPESVTSIGDDAFRSCSALTEVNFGADSLLNSIGRRAFRFCSNLTSITIPDSVTSIGECAFQSCKALTEVNFGEDSQLASIGEIAFNLCFSLTSITIPDSVTSIGSDAFIECYALAEVYNYSRRFTIDYNKTSNGYLGYYAQVIYNASDLEGAKPATKIQPYENVQYYVDGTTRIALLPAVPRESLISVTLHPDTTEINHNAFYNCTSMTNITIPKGVISIGYSAFDSCTSLETVTIDSGDIYEDLTSDTACGRLIENATTIRVLESIIDGGLYTNTYLNGTTFTRSPNAVDGYYEFTR